MPTRLDVTPFLPDLAGWRRIATLSVFALLALLQGLAPLLHAHVLAAAATAQGGVHLPVAIAHAIHAGVAIDTACASTDEGGIVTVPPEIRRDRPLALDLPTVILTPPTLAARTANAVSVGTAVIPHHAGTSFIGLPPAHGPPVTV